MPTYTIETSCHLPVYRQRTYSADTLEDACLLAIDDDGWDDGEEDVETSGETFVSGIWEGELTIVDAWLAIPDRFAETVERKAELFDELIALLREPAQPMGLSEHDFRNWLPRAMAILAKADAIQTDDAASP